MTSKEPQQYRLKPGIDLRITDLKDGLSFVHYQDDYVQWETEHVNAIFETIDEDAIRKKVTEMINTAYKIGYIHDTSYLSDLTVDDALEICVDAILSLITGVTLGRKQ